jgi:hypothetical protein
MRHVATAVVIVEIACASVASAGGFPFPTPATRTPTRTPTPTPTPVVAATLTPTPTPTPAAPVATPPPTPPAGWDLTANLLPCVQAPVSRRLGPGAKVEVITSTGRWEIRPNPAGADKCWLTVDPPGRAVSVGSAFKIRWSLGSAYEEMDAGVVVQVRATRGSYPGPSSKRVEAPTVLLAATGPSAN